MHTSLGIVNKYGEMLTLEKIIGIKCLDRNVNKKQNTIMEMEPNIYS